MDKKNLQIHRSNENLRLEIMPLLDVIFLLLTFFIYSMVISVQAERLPIQMEQYSASNTFKTDNKSFFITIRINGDILIDNETRENPIEYLRTKISAATKSNEILEQYSLYILLEENVQDINDIKDRGPILTKLFNDLQGLDVKIFLIGRPKTQ